MRYTKLGRTGLDVSVIGIGMEHMRGQPRETVVSVVREAIERGVTYFDVIFAMADYLDNMACRLSRGRYMCIYKRRDRHMRCTDLLMATGGKLPVIELLALSCHWR